MLIKTRGLVFRTVKYGDSSVIADIFTLEKGLQTFIASGVRAAKSRFAPGLLQPMASVELVAYFKENASMHRIKELSAGIVFGRSPFETRRGAVALFFAEVARKAIREHEASPPLFDFLERNLVFLDRYEGPLANLHLHFLAHLTEHLGFWPGGEHSAETPFFDLQEGFFVENRPAHPFFLHGDEARALSALLSSPLETAAALPLGRELRKGVLAGLLRFYQLHLERFGEIRTPDVLEMVFD